jgi:hypothetical protein
MLGGCCLSIPGPDPGSAARPSELKREIPATHETELRATLQQAIDHNREVKVTVLGFNVPR